ncbi:hypothetical protein FH972_022705 [Carpinus fangiana]|uniref:Uncharacterized protein n=1 Tax=Carpinus fangiana TaxID=176857 RepID=A0A5N6KTC1_9ROSI|nr:hypothetical protein FH972_022705 [Carpinus fangiana]
MAQGGKVPKKPTSALVSKKATHSAQARSKTAKYTPQSKVSKNARVAKQQKQMRKSAAGLTGNLEKRLAERAGYTEMIGVKGGARREDVAKTGMSSNRKSGAKKN